MPELSIATAIECGQEPVPQGKPVAGDSGVPELENSDRLPVRLITVQALPEASMAIPAGSCRPPPVRLRLRVKSLG